MSNNGAPSSELKKLEARIKILEEKLESITKRGGTLDKSITTATLCNRVLKHFTFEADQNNIRKEWLAFRGNLLIYGCTWLKKDVLMENDVTIRRNLKVDSNVADGGDVSVGGDLAVSGNVNVKGRVTKG